MFDRPLPPLPPEKPPRAELRWAQLEAKSEAMVEELVQRCGSQRSEARHLALSRRHNAAFVAAVVVTLIWLWL